MRDQTARLEGAKRYRERTNRPNTARKLKLLSRRLEAECVLAADLDASLAEKQTPRNRALILARRQNCVKQIGILTTRVEVVVARLREIISTEEPAA